MNSYYTSMYGGLGVVPQNILEFQSSAGTIWALLILRAGHSRLHGHQQLILCHTFLPL